MSTPFSNLVAASVLSSWRNAVFLTKPLSKQADSRNIDVVVALTPLFMPPYTPAIHMGSCSLQIIKSLPLSFLSFSSSVLNNFPSSENFTITLLPEMVLASNACKGCPVSCKIKLVMSTILLIGLKPMLFNFCCSHSGLSVTVMFEMLTPQ